MDDKARRQLEDPTGRLTDDVMAMLAKFVIQTSPKPKARILDPLWIQVDEFLPADRLTKARPIQPVIYVPLHHQAGGGHWTMAVIRRDEARVDFYDSLQSGPRFRTVVRRMKPLLRDSFPGITFAYIHHVCFSH